jgi:maltoporin
VHVVPRFLSETGENKLSLQLGYGPAKTFTSGFTVYGAPNGLFYIQPDYKESWRFRVTEQFTAKLNEHLALQPTLVYQYTEQGQYQGINQGYQQWLSAGVRPIFFFNKYFNVALEGGVDWVQDSLAGTSSYLTKLTLAPQIALGDNFFSRPVLRLFVTYATWGDDFMGQVGGADYKDKTHGFTWGLQMETWW